MGSFYGNAVSAVNSQNGGAYLVDTELHDNGHGFMYLELLDSWENIVQELNKGPVIIVYSYTKEIDGTTTEGEEAASAGYTEEKVVYLPVYSASIIRSKPQGSSAPFELNTQIFSLQVGWLQEDEESISANFEIKRAAAGQSTSNPTIAISEGEQIPTPGGGEIVNPAL